MRHGAEHEGTAESLWSESADGPDGIEDDAPSGNEAAASRSQRSLPSPGPSAESTSCRTTPSPKSSSASEAWALSSSAPCSPASAARASRNDDLPTPRGPRTTRSEPRPLLARRRASVACASSDSRSQSIVLLLGIAHAEEIRNCPGEMTHLSLKS